MASGDIVEGGVQLQISLVGFNEKWQVVLVPLGVTRHSTLGTRLNTQCKPAGNTFQLFNITANLSRLWIAFFGKKMEQNLVELTYKTGRHVCK